MSLETSFVLTEVYIIMFSLLVSELFFLILAHPINIQEPNTLEL